MYFEAHTRFPGSDSWGTELGYLSCLTPELILLCGLVRNPSEESEVQSVGMAFMTPNDLTPVLLPVPSSCLPAGHQDQAMLVRGPWGKSGAESGTGPYQPGIY